MRNEQLGYFSGVYCYGYASLGPGPEPLAYQWLISQGLTSANLLNCWIDFAQSEALKPMLSSVQSVSAVQCQALLVEFRVISVVEGLSRELMALAVVSCMQRMTRRG